MNNLKNSESEIKQLIELKDFRKAYDLCNEILKIDPTNHSFLKLKQKIEEDVKNLNLKEIDQEIKQIHQLAKDRKFDQAYEKIRLLQPYIENYPELNPKIDNLKLSLSQEYNRFNQASLKELTSKIKSLTHEKKFDEALKLIQTIPVNPKNKASLEKQKQQIKSQYADEEIRKNQALFESEKFDDSIIFLINLKKIAPSNKKVDIILNQIKKRQANFRAENYKDEIFKLNEEIKTLFQLKKYDKILEVAEKIFIMNPNSKTTKNLLRISLKKIDQECIKTLKTNILQNYQTISASLKQNRAEIQKI